MPDVSARGGANARNPVNCLVVGHLLQQGTEKIQALNFMSGGRRFMKLSASPECPSLSELDGFTRLPRFVSKRAGIRGATGYAAADFQSAHWRICTGQRR